MEILLLDLYNLEIYNQSMITRLLEKQILEDVQSREVLIINGPRRVGKTTLIKQIKEKLGIPDRQYFDFTDPADVQLWHDYSSRRIMAILEDLGLKETKGILLFDEIQYFDNIGLLFKLIFDHFPHIKVIATGSSSFLFLQNIGDSLAGRKKLFFLYPLSLGEETNFLPEDYWKFKIHPVRADELTEVLKQTLVYGNYPEIFLMNDAKSKVEKLKEISDSFLFKDLLMIESIKKPRVIVEISRLLAHQVGNLVNPNEIAASVGISRDTVVHYIDLLEKFFIIFRVYPYEKNLREVIKGKFKVYFYDPGIRNALTGNFSSIESREDRGYLLENAVMLGLKRRIDYDKTVHQLYFWRNYEGREVDIVLTGEETIGLEVKWNSQREKISRSFFAQAEIIDHTSAYRYML